MFQKLINWFTAWADWCDSRIQDRKRAYEFAKNGQYDTASRIFKRLETPADTKYEHFYLRHRKYLRPTWWIVLGLLFIVPIVPLIAKVPATVELVLEIFNIENRRWQDQQLQSPKKVDWDTLYRWNEIYAWTLIIRTLVMIVVVLAVIDCIFFII